MLAITHIYIWILLAFEHIEPVERFLVATVMSYLLVAEMLLKKDQHCHAFMSHEIASDN